MGGGRSNAPPPQQAVENPEAQQGAGCAVCVCVCPFACWRSEYFNISSRTNCIL